MSNTRAKSIVYWITTCLIAFDATLAGLLYLSHAPFLVRAFARMGYPLYFVNILGVAQLLGVGALLVPRHGTVKEWAYAGFGFIYIGGFISHFVSGDGLEALEPLALFAILVASYVTRPAQRRARQ